MCEAEGRCGSSKRSVFASPSHGLLYTSPAQTLPLRGQKGRHKGLRSERRRSETRRQRSPHMMPRHRFADASPWLLYAARADNTADRLLTCWQHCSNTGRASSLRQCFCSLRQCSTSRNSLGETTQTTPGRNGSKHNAKGTEISGRHGLSLPPPLLPLPKPFGAQPPPFRRPPG